MSSQTQVPKASVGAANRIYAFLSNRQKPASAFVSSPEPRSIGSFARGRQLVAGNLQFGGHLYDSPGTLIWDLGAPSTPFEAERQGSAWLDDLAAVGDGPARHLAQTWVWGWIDRFHRGRGPGWTPDLTGRRVIRWINHAIFLLSGTESSVADRFYRALSRQAWFLSKRWHAAAPGLPRFEALTGLIYAALSLEGMEHLADPAIKALARECDQQIDAQGGLPTRNPEDLLEVFVLLTWAAAALHEAGRTLPEPHMSAIERIAPTLRNLRHVDGGLARFHGGGRGLEGRLDQALATSHVVAKPQEGLAMGFARMAAGRTSVILDGAAPPTGAAAACAHASTLAFELTSGRRPVVVNCGSGETFGLDWRRAGRATPSHSTLCLDGYSSARLESDPRDPQLEKLIDAPRDVPVELTRTLENLCVRAGHDGYVKGDGLTHARTLELSLDGRTLEGEDMLVAVDKKGEKQFDRMLERSDGAGAGFAIRFHLHPDVDVALDLGGTAVSMALKSGEIWIFRHDGQAKLDLVSSVYLEKGRLKPRATNQVVLSGAAMGYATRIRWSLAKAQDTEIAIRDLHRDDLAATD